MVLKEQMEIQKFFAMLFGIAREGYVEIRPMDSEYKPDWERRKWVPVNEQIKFAQTVLKLKENYHVFFGVCTRSNQGEGTKEFVNEMVCLWADLDGKRYQGGMEQALEVLQNYRFPPSAIVATGHGYHSYWFFEESYDLSKGHAKPEAVLKALQVEELNSDPVSDLSRVLRVPNTLNIKDPDNPKPVRIKKLENIRYSFEELAKKLDWKAVIDKDYDTKVNGNRLKEESYEGLEKVLKSDFIKHCKKNAKELPEPVWYAMITNLIPFKGGRKKIHQLSKPYPGYTKKETEQKINHALKDAPGPHTVNFLKEHGFKSEDCQKAGVKSPAGLAFKNRKEDS